MSTNTAMQCAPHHAVLDNGSSCYTGSPRPQTHTACACSGGASRRTSRRGRRRAPCPCLSTAPPGSSPRARRCRALRRRASCMRPPATSTPPWARGATCRVSTRRARRATRRTPPPLPRRAVSCGRAAGTQPWRRPRRGRTLVDAQRVGAPSRAAQALRLTRATTRAPPPSAPRYPFSSARRPAACAASRGASPTTPLRVLRPHCPTQDT